MSEIDVRVSDGRSSMIHHEGSRIHRELYPPREVRIINSHDHPGCTRVEGRKRTLLRLKENTQKVNLAVAESQGSLPLHSELKIATHRHRVPLVSERLGDPLHFPELVGFLDAVPDLPRSPR